METFIEDDGESVITLNMSSMHAVSIFWRRTIRVSVDLPLFQVEGAALHLRGYYNAVLPESHQRRLQILDVLQIGLVVLELLRAESLTIARVQIIGFSRMTVRTSSSVIGSMDDATNLSIFKMKKGKGLGFGRGPISCPD